MNKIILIGNLTADPKLGYTQGTNIPVCNFTIAVKERRSGEDKTQFFRVTVWRNLGEACAKYLSKGKKVFVSGALSFSTYQRSDGETGVNLEVTAADVEFLSPRDHGHGQTAPDVPSAYAQPQGFTPVDTGNDIPF